MVARSRSNQAAVWKKVKTMEEASDGKKLLAFWTPPLEKALTHLERFNAKACDELVQGEPGEKAVLTVEIRFAGTIQLDAAAASGRSDHIRGVLKMMLRDMERKVPVAERICDLPIIEWTDAIRLIGWWGKPNKAAAKGDSDWEEAAEHIGELDRRLLKEGDERGRSVRDYLGTLESDGWTWDGSGGMWMRERPAKGE